MWSITVEDFDDLTGSYKKNMYISDIIFLQNVTTKLLEYTENNENTENKETLKNAYGGEMSFFTDDKEFKDSGWKYWAGLVINNITNLDKELKSLKEHIDESTSSLHSELKSDRCDINEIKIAIQEFKRIGDKITDLKEDISEIKHCYNLMNKDISTMNKDITKLKIKSGAWGAVSGAISAGLAGLIYLLIGK